MSGFSLLSLMQKIENHQTISIFEQNKSMRIITLFLFFINLPLVAQTDFYTAEKLFLEKKYEESKKSFEFFLKNNPNNLQAIEYLGDIAGQQQKWDAAVTYYKFLKNQNPKSSKYWYKYGGALGMKAKNCNKFKALGMISDIENSFLIASKLDSKNVDPRWALVYFYLELPGILGGSEKKAERYSDELIEISKVDGYLSKGYIAESLNKYQVAENFYLKAHSIGNSKVTYQKLYDLYTKKLKNFDKAKKLTTI
jgi:tetratricopeptide (TPR) repeat protein